jgi:hypothetical protein
MVDEPTMLKWINEILASYAVTALEGVVPILFLNSFSVHMKATVVNAIQYLGVQVEFIPPGCTGLLTLPCHLVERQQHCDVIVGGFVCVFGREKKTLRKMSAVFVKSR